MAKKITKTINKICKNCEDSFTVRDLYCKRKQIFCSNKCSNKYINKNHPNKGKRSGRSGQCKICNKDYYTYNNRKYCSDRCYHNDRLSLRLDKTCIACNKLFKVIKSQNNRKYCSFNCKKEHFKPSIEQRLKVSKKFKGKSFIERYGEKKAKEIFKKLSKFQQSRGPRTEINRRRSRIAYLKYVDKKIKKGGQILPNYNINACDLIEKYGKENKYNFQHALNKGEYHIKELGFWLDGYDKKKNVAIEFYEKNHYYNSELNKKTINREKEIINFLNCKFIRIHYNLKIEIIKI